MQSIQNAVQTQFWAVRDYLAPVLRDSKFKEHGRITPEEFVAAGDFLVYKFPTWQWQAGDKSKQRDYLPPDKQFLIQREVPCIRRVSQMHQYSGNHADDDKEELIRFDANELLGDADASGEDNEDWVATHVGAKPRDSAVNAAEIPDITEATSSTSTAHLSHSLATTSLSNQSQHASVGAPPHLADIPDIEDDDLAGTGVMEAEDEAAAPSSVQTQFLHTDASGNTLSVRTYDCYITYDKYYQVPRMWLTGQSPLRLPLNTNEIFEDVSSDYAQKTVTIEPFPHKENISMASVHPCKHANVMKKVIERMNNAVKQQQRAQREAEVEGVEPSSTSGQPVKQKKKGWGITSTIKKAAGVGNSVATSTVKSDDAVPVEGLRVDQYLLVFLKFLSNVVPTIELDATTSL